MKIYPIFVGALYSFYVDKKTTEWQKSYNELTDIVFLENFFHQYENDLMNGFYKGKVNNVTDAVMQTRKMAHQFYGSVLTCCKRGDSLDQIFKSLHNKESFLNDLLLTKAKNEDRKCSWLRMYGLKVESGIYSITGGTIKLTELMEERSHTEKELLKLGKYKSLLQKESIFDKDSLLDYIENR